MLETAIRSLLAERPLADISILDIAERAELNRATFYAHFKSKEDLASTVLREGLQQAIFERLATAKRFNAESLGVVAIATFEYVEKISKVCTKHGPALADSMASSLQETLQQFFVTWFKRDPKAMGWFPKVPAEVVATVLAWSLYGGAIRWSRLSNRPTVAEAAKQIVDLLITQPSLDRVGGSVTFSK